MQLTEIKLTDASKFVLKDVEYSEKGVTGISNYSGNKIFIPYHAILFITM